MVKVRKNKIILIVTCCLALILCISLGVDARQWQTSLKPALLKQVLVSAGIEAEQDVLYHHGIFLKVLSLKGPEDVPVVIGFPKDGIRKGEPFMLVADGIEYGVKMTEDGDLMVINGDAELISQGVLDMVECILLSVEDMLEMLAECDILDVYCFVEAAITGSIAISLCPLNIL